MRLALIPITTLHFLYLVPTKKYISKGSVFVLFGIYPATINVAPNSPNARAKLIIIPAKIERLANGKINLRKISFHLLPSF